ncbi:MAG: hypothetical protein HYV33_04865 [Candidatus Kerfeldbacteria bacterium]|nr:hypothetical protein [Candidatus Kerfeldbacteria bacterium]
MSVHDKSRELRLVGQKPDHDRTEQCRRWVVIPGSKFLSTDIQFPQQPSVYYVRTTELDEPAKIQPGSLDDMIQTMHGAEALDFNVGLQYASPAEALAAAIRLQEKLSQPATQKKIIRLYEVWQAIQRHIDAIIDDE